MRLQALFVRMPATNASQTAYSSSRRKSQPKPELQFLWPPFSQMQYLRIAPSDPFSQRKLPQSLHAYHCPLFRTAYSSFCHKEQPHVGSQCQRTPSGPQRFRYIPPSSLFYIFNRAFLTLRRGRPSTWLLILSLNWAFIVLIYRIHLTLSIRSS